MALYVLGWGRSNIAYLQWTPRAVANEQDGQLLIVGASCALLVIAALVSRAAPAWVLLAIATPAVLCGALTFLAHETFLPQLAALPSFLIAVTGLIGLLASRTP